MTHEELARLLSIGLEAAELVRGVYARPFDVDYKAPGDPVTLADRAANDLICERLEKDFPGSPIVAEESPPERFAEYRDHDRIFFVDPVDGTREFVEKNGEFVVMIGVVEGTRAVASVICAPTTRQAWLGLVGQGAFALDEHGQRTPIHVSNTRSLQDASIVASRSHRTPALERTLRLVGAREIRAVGSAGLKGAHVASGAADAYVSPGYAGKRWDACPSDALVVAAGGRLSDAHGNDIDYRAQDLSNDAGIVVTNGLLHEAVLERLAHARAHG